MDVNETFDSARENELDRERADLSGLLDGYRREVLDEIEPSAAHRAAVHKMLLGLVTEDVLARKRRASFATLLAARWQRFCDCWSELAAGSLAFRLTSQLALALGVGLVLSILTIASIDQGSRADERRMQEQDGDLLPEGEVFDLSIPRRDGLGALPGEVPEEEAAPERDPFEERR